MSVCINKKSNTNQEIMKESVDNLNKTRAVLLLKYFCMGIKEIIKIPNNYNEILIKLQIILNEILEIITFYKTVYLIDNYIIYKGHKDHCYVYDSLYQNKIDIKNKLSHINPESSLSLYEEKLKNVIIKENYFFCDKIYEDKSDKKYYRIFCFNNNEFITVIELNYKGLYLKKYKIGNILTKKIEPLLKDNIYGLFITKYKNKTICLLIIVNKSISKKTLSDTIFNANNLIINNVNPQIKIVNNVIYHKMVSDKDSTIYSIND